jgi:nucleoside-diphosphate-sugar epimerase
MDHMGNDLTPILVTGASGYLGNHVIRKLRDKRLAAVALTHEDCDLTNLNAVRTVLERINPKVVIHCAASVPKAWASYGNDWAAESSLAMVDSLSRYAACPIILTSSMALYTGLVSFPVSEDQAVPPKSGYALGKWQAEQLLFSRDHIGDVALRLPGLFGLPRRSGLLYNAAKSFITTGKFEYQVLPDIWAAMAVEDAADYVVDFATSQISLKRASQAVNIGYEEKFDIPNAVNEIAVLCGVTQVQNTLASKSFSMNLDRLRSCCVLLSATFRQRLEELVIQVSKEHGCVGE